MCGNLKRGFRLLLRVVSIVGGYGHASVFHGSVVRLISSSNRGQVRLYIHLRYTVSKASRDTFDENTSRISIHAGGA